MGRAHNSNFLEIQKSTRARGSFDRIGSVADASNPGSLTFSSILEEVQVGLIGSHLGFGPFQILLPCLLITWNQVKVFRSCTPAPVLF